MKKEDMIAIGNMRLQGKSAGAIAVALGLSVNTVKSYLRRHPDMGCTHFCPQCGKPVMQVEGRKEKKFCSDQCRSRWWNSHPSEINKKAYYRLVCHQCGKEFEVYGNSAADRRKSYTIIAKRHGLSLDSIFTEKT